MSRTRLVLEGRWAYVLPQFNPITVPRRVNPLLRHIASSRSQSTFIDADWKSPNHGIINDTTQVAPAGEPESNVKISRAGESQPQVRQRANRELNSTHIEDCTIKYYEDKVYRSGKESRLYVTKEALQSLIVQHQQEPKVWYYKSWVLANRNPKLGSAATLHAVWDEVFTEGLGIDSDCLHAFLQALAYHPDYLLRTTVLNKMEQRWISLNPDGWNHVVAGMLKETQYALAAEKLQQMRSMGIPVFRWVDIAFAHCLIGAGEYAEAFEAMQEINKRGDGLTPMNTILSLLEATSEDYNSEITTRLWEEMVSPGFLNPSSGVCHKILIMAVRARDLALASKVFQHLAARVDVPSLDACEPLFDLYISSGDIEGAINFLCAMKESGLEASEFTVRSLVDLCGSGQVVLERDPLAILKQMISKVPSVKSTVPVELINAGMEIRLRAKDFVSIKEVFDQYSIYCSSPPNLRSYFLLFKACRQLQDLQAVVDYYHKWRQSSAPSARDSHLFGSLISTSIDAEDFSSATQFLLAAQDEGIDMPSQTLKDWLSTIDQKTPPSSNSLNVFREKLEHAVLGGSLREDIQRLSFASTEINPFEVQAKKRAKEVERARSRTARMGYGLRSSAQTRGRKTTSTPVGDEKGFEKEKEKITKSDTDAQITDKLATTTSSQLLHSEAVAERSSSSIVAESNTTPEDKSWQSIGGLDDLLDAAESAGAKSRRRRGWKGK